MKKHESLYKELNCLIVFRALLEDEAMSALLKLLACRDEAAEIMECYSIFFSLLLEDGEDLTEFLARRIRLDENVYIKKAASGSGISEALQKRTEYELELFNRLAGIKSEELLSKIPGSDDIMDWTNSGRDIKNEYLEYAKGSHRLGYGIFVDNRMFSFENLQIKAIKNPDSIRLSDLSGYERARGRVVENTRALLAGKRAANVLLYGDAGTGKSSTVKAIVNEYAGEGLRLVEVSKQRLMEIPTLLEKLNSNPLKFIVFIDDLSFDQSSDEFGALKAILEGSAGMKPDNVTVYATGNRRQIVRQSFMDRAGDDIHAGETMQDQLALAERFGLSVGFFRPDKDEYLKIVWDLAKQYGLKNTENLELSAERFALERGGRSGRTARQLIEYLIALE